MCHWRKRNNGNINFFTDTITAPTPTNIFLFVRNNYRYSSGRRYSPCRVSAFLTTCLQSCRSSAFLLQPLTPSFLRSSSKPSTSPGHLQFIQILPRLWWSIRKKLFFYEVEMLTLRSNLNLEDQGTFVRIITLDLPGLGDPASSYATAGIALRIIWPSKPHHYFKVEILTTDI
jgi:hypothetical protein